MDSQLQLSPFATQKDLLQNLFIIPTSPTQISYLIHHFIAMSQIVAGYKKCLRCNVIYRCNDLQAQ